MTIRKLLILTFLFFLTFVSFSQNRIFDIDRESKVIATKFPENTLNFKLNESVYERILSDRLSIVDIQLPFFNRDIDIQLIAFSIFNSNSKFVSKTITGDVELDLNPTILSYKIKYKEQFIGVLNFVNNTIVGTFKLEGKQYEITKFKGKYLLFETSNSINTSNFSCAVEHTSNANNFQQMQLPSASSVVPVCVELAVEIDQFTRQTFSSDLEAINWSLAIMAGVSLIYENQTNSAIQVTYTYVWNTADPYSAWIAQSSSMLTELKSYWQTNNSGVSRDLVHLMTKRGNTGTGGIAYLDVLCDNNWGYGFSASLNNDTTYSFPNPSYTWNLTVCSHELGHNFGSKHTHWCGWVSDPLIPFAGGNIDNCVNVQGTCPNNPTPILGTIMSYCHTTSGGLTLNFHDVVVSQALDLGIANASCLTTCDYYGCTDQTAFNYNPNATIDDGSCIPKIFGCIDVLATNYDPLSNTDDGSCTYCSDISVSISNISCYGYSDGAIDLTVSNGNSPYGFTWTGPNGFSAFTEDISNIGVPGIYQVIVEDALQCKDTSDLTIVMPDTIIITSVITNPVSCNGLSDGSVALNITGGTPPYNEDYGIYNPVQLSANIYSVVVTDANTCPQVSESFTIIEPDQLQASSMVNNISCNNFNDGDVDLLVLGGTFPFLYLWTGPNGFSAVSQDITSLAQGSYSLSITDANNCLASDQVTIINPLPLSSSVSTQNASCNGGYDGGVFLTLSGGTTPYFYVWNNGALSQNLININANNYSVNISDDNGCTLPTINTNITEPNPSSVSYSNTEVSCFSFSDGSIDVNYQPINSSISYSFLWSDGSVTEDISGLNSGFYTLNILENNTCNITLSINITQPNVLAVTESTNYVSCLGGNNGSSSVIATGGTPFYSFLWSNGSSSSSITNLLSGIYYYTVTDNNLCVLNDSILITEPASLISFSDSIIDVNCYNGGDGEAYLSVNGGGFPYQISWMSNNPLSLNYGFHSFEILDTYNCLVLDSVFVNQPQQIIVNEIVIDAKCYNEPSGSVVLGLIGGVSPYLVNWFGADNNNLLAGNYIYNITDSNLCIISNVVTIQEPSEIIVSNLVSPATCFDSNNGSVILNINGGITPYIVNWLGQDPQMLSTGNHQYLVTDSNACIDNNQVFIYSLSDISVIESIDNISCFGRCDGEISMLISGGIPPYISVIKDVFGDIIITDSLCEGEYYYTITDNLSCQLTDTFIINEPDMLVLTVNVQGNISEANVTGGTTPYFYTWNDSLGYLGNTSQITINNLGPYSCVVYDANYCFSDSVFIKPLQSNMTDYSLSYILIYPNPTAGNIEIYNIDKEVTVNVLNSLGQLVFEKMIYSENNKAQLNLSELSNGIYHLWLKTDEKSYNKKLIIQNLE